MGLVQCGQFNSVGFLTESLPKDELSLTEAIETLGEGSFIAVAF